MKKTFLVLLVLIFVTSCAGGGTTGTGSPASYSVRGSLTNVDGEAIANALVENVETGVRVLSGDDGNFEIRDQFIDGDIHLLIESDSSFSQVVSINENPAEDSIINISVLIDVENNQISATVLSVELLSDAESSNEDSELEDENSIEEGTALEEEPTAPQRSSEIKGQVLFDDGSPAIGVRLSLFPGRQSLQTNTAGRFSFEGKFRSQNLRIQAEYLSFTGSIVLSDLPKQAFITTIELTLKDIEPPSAPANGEIEEAKGGLEIEINTITTKEK